MCEIQMRSGVEHALASAGMPASIHSVADFISFNFHTLFTNPCTGMTYAFRISNKTKTESNDVIISPEFSGYSREI